jgi:GR25 family glycosyltransferase involved in LPS biosynthesis
MKTGLSRQANELVRSGKYFKALEAYRNLKSVSGLSSWDWNIRALERRLGTDRTVFVSSEFGGILREHAGIERIYIANLKHRTDRKVRFVTEFSKYGINPLDIEIVEAVNGATDSQAQGLFELFKIADSSKFESIRAVPKEVLEYDRSHSSLGVIGYLLTQKIILRDALSKGYKRILVFDDDVFFSKQACELIYRFFKQRIDWRIVHLGSSEHSPKASDGLRRRLRQASICGYYNPIPYQTCGSFAVAYDCSIFIKLLQLVTEYVGVYDRSILSYFYNSIPGLCFTLHPAACCADVSESDIRDSRTMNEHALRMGWDMSRYAEYRGGY